jgi:hypothetical protein
VRATWWQEKQDEVVDRSRCRVAAHDRSLHGVCVGSPENRRVTWLSHKSKTGGSTDGDGIRAHREASMPADAWRDRGAGVGRTRSPAMAWPCDEEECYMTYLPLRGLYQNLSSRGSVVFCLARRGLIYISSRVSRQTIHPDCFSFPCSIGLDSSSVCKESDLRVNGSFHGCVDSPLVARWIFVPFRAIFVGFSCASCSFDSEVFGFEFVGGDHG